MRITRCGENQGPAFFQNAVEFLERPQLIGKVLYTFLAEQVINALVSQGQALGKIRKFGADAFERHELRKQVERPDRCPLLQEFMSRASIATGNINDNLAIEPRHASNVCPDVSVYAAEIEFFFCRHKKTP